MKNHMTREQWFSLPKVLRQRWWVETNFDRNPPPQELLDDVKQALQSKQQEDDDGV